MLYGGSTKLRPYEFEILQRACSELEEPDRSALSRQIAGFDRVQRNLNDRQVLFFFKPNQDLAHLTERGDAQCLVRFKLRGQGGRSSAAVVSHHGLLSSLEFARAPKPLFEAGVEVLAVVRGGRWQGPAEAADRLEHGV
jgi:hypothetical protein